MYVPQVYAVALGMMILSMICWGSWANTQKAASGWQRLPPPRLLESDLMRLR
jgi:hypothetical protein